jgi:uncharacterized protein YaaN involved in tellurite resistance
MSTFATISVGLCKLKPPSKSNGNGNGKVTLKDIEESLKTEIKLKQDIAMCEEVKRTVQERHNDLKKWTMEISTQNQITNVKIESLNVQMKSVIEGINDLKERRKEGSRYDQYRISEDKKAL